MKLGVNINLIVFLLFVIFVRYVANVIQQ